MASSSRRRGGGRGRGVTDTPLFYTIMLPRILAQGKIEIPPEFVRKYGAHFPERMQIRDPAGNWWAMQLEQAGGKLWLGKGWMKFQEHYHLGFGSLVLFQLHGGGLFHVTIFDRTCMEIKYPLKRAQGARSDVTDDSIPFDMEDFEIGAARSRRPDSPVIEIDDSSSGNGLSAYFGSGSDHFEAESSRRRRPREEEDVQSPRGSAGKERSGKSLKQPLPPCSTRVLDRATRFKTKGPSFIIQMRRSYLRSGGMSISKKYMKKAGIQEGFHPVELRREGKSWPVKLLCYPEEHRGKLCRGWAGFLADNQLAAGDVCVFELLKKNVFYVHIFSCSN